MTIVCTQISRIPSSHAACLPPPYVCRTMIALVCANAILWDPRDRRTLASMQEAKTVLYDHFALITSDSHMMLTNANS